MMNIIPSVKLLEQGNGFLEKRALCYNPETYDKRLAAALAKLPYDCGGAKLEISVTGDAGEAYELWINADSIRIEATGIAGAFYAIQTLRQIFKHDRIPCLHIKDEPDFPYRGFYHDVTRGKVPTLESIKELIDQMAYYKLNSLQLYVEHAYEFEECKDLIQSTGYLTKEEIRQIDDYCQANFIEFIPSLSTFGHLYELLQQKKYQHLRVLKDYEPLANFWRARMIHHTIDPLNPESLELVTSLIDQYIPLFTSDTFNICCDETFDLKTYEASGQDVGALYVGFVKKIINHVKSRGKKVMMWGDILLQHPETIQELPEDTYFLNWFYRIDPPEEDVIRFAQSGRPQIVCPGTTTWNRFCEDVDVEENNICLMAEYGHKHGAVGVLNTNWGDWGNPCSVELAMYGMVLGAEKSWSVETRTGDAFYSAVNFHLYENEKGVQYLKELSRLQDQVNWRNFSQAYFIDRFKSGEEFPPAFEGDIGQFQNGCRSFIDSLSAERSFSEEFRQEMLLAAEGVCMMAELFAAKQGSKLHRMIDTKQWLLKYRAKWAQKNKESELRNIEDMFLYCDENWSR